MFVIALGFASILLAGCTSGDSTVVSETTLVDSAPTGETSEEVFPETPQLIIANSAGSVSTSGEQRMMTALVGGENNSFLGSPDRPIMVAFEPVDGDSVGGSVEASWLTTNASELGLYVSRFSFDEPGVWEVTVSDGPRELASSLFEIVEDSPVPQPGELAPPSITPTAATVSELSDVSTDMEPDSSFYDLTIAEAVGNGNPTMIVFATPAFCQTALCGPTLDFAKGAAAGQSELDVVHVEPFDLELAPTGTLEPIDAMFDYGLATEPWIFLVDSDGVISHSFEGIIGQAELEAALSS